MFISLPRIYKAIRINMIDCYSKLFFNYPPANRVDTVMLKENIAIFNGWHHMTDHIRAATSFQLPFSLTTGDKMYLDASLVSGMVNSNHLIDIDCLT